jgi:hypothetical protein
VQSELFAKVGLLQVTVGGPVTGPTGGICACTVNRSPCVEIAPNANANIKVLICFFISHSLSILAWKRNPETHESAGEGPLSVT